MMLVTFAVSLLAAAPVEINCPAGTAFVEGKGCLAKVAEPECPAGTHFEGTKCVAVVDTSCPPGMVFKSGTGCVTKGAAKAVAKQEEAPAQKQVAVSNEAETKPKKRGTSSGGFSDRLVGTCNGAEVEVQARSTLLGGLVILKADDKVVETGEVSVGGNTTLRGQIRGQAAKLLVEQGVFKTRYTLTVGAKPCQLHDT